MNAFSQMVLLWLLMGCGLSGKGQSVRQPAAQRIGGGCDGCELMFVGMPATLNLVDTSVGWRETGQKLLVTGTVYKIDGRTPAPNVVLYYWHTNPAGYYAPGANTDARARLHGARRGWVRTDAAGRYAIYTNRPAPYPNASEPAHIHISVKEPNIPTEYYIDDIVFDDDPLVIAARKKRPFQNRGGSGIVRIVKAGPVQIAEHTLVLGLNVPNYPTATPVGSSGLNIGEESPSFMPYHVWGPDKGTRTCPVCQYGRYQGVLFFVGNHPNWPDISRWLAFLDQESNRRGRQLKVYFIYGNAREGTQQSRYVTLERLGRRLRLQHVALTLVPSFADLDSEVHLNNIDPDVANTFIMYQHRRIVDKYVDLAANAEGFARLTNALDRTKSPYAALPVLTPDK